ncbi:MAG: hypothetical protein ACO1NV_03345 [Leptospira bouyouniensis]|uniref:Uncharacterized protein n=1 Tax=Leptospira bouyouniensis TaxID=2484911 RepID=A0A7I0HM93_9LEPT|nr:hypothetical protein [Leptospira bouyouniensis]TGK48664.1 hypothetical protein EHQ10_13245 [Leptospira bouyouniensis]TGL02248.1 hypothetical protein EHQ43_17975 [Leptospira bouyouniensis]TGM81035.1 hypothetical protein EHQ99_15510 [Leptospira bouyouniensis]
MNFIIKTILLLMTFSVFLAVFQLLLKSETIKNQTPIATTKSKKDMFSAVLRDNQESIPNFVSRFKVKSFELWENADKLKMEIKY